MNFPALRDESQRCLRNNDKLCLVAIYSELTKREPGNLAWPANLAFNMTDLGYHEQAIEVYSKIADAPEATYDIMAYYGLSLQRLERHAEAVHWFKRALSINSKLADTTRELAISLVYLGEVDEAKSVILEFVNKFPDSSNYFSDISAQIVNGTQDKKKINF